MILPSSSMGASATQLSAILPVAAHWPSAMQLLVAARLVVAAHWLPQRSNGRRRRRGFHNGGFANGGGRRGVPQRRLDERRLAELSRPAGSLTAMASASEFSGPLELLVCNRRRSAISIAPTATCRIGSPPGGCPWKPWTRRLHGSSPAAWSASRSRLLWHAGRADGHAAVLFYEGSHPPCWGGTTAPGVTVHQSFQTNATLLDEAGATSSGGTTFSWASVSMAPPSCTIAAARRGRVRAHSTASWRHSPAARARHPFLRHHRPDGGFAKPRRRTLRLLPGTTHLPRSAFNVEEIEGPNTTRRC